MRGAALLALCTLVAAAQPAAAQTRSVSYSTWILSQDSVMLRFLLPGAVAQTLIGAGTPLLSSNKLGEYVLAHTQVRAAGRECPASDQGYDLGKVDPIDAGPGSFGFEIVFRCSGPLSDLSLHDHALFRQAPLHVNFARIEAGGRSVQQLFTTGHEELRIPDVRALPAAGLGSYVQLGLLHVLRSPDRLCFLLAVLLLVRQRLDLAEVVLGLAAGYGLSLLVQSIGLLQPEMTLVGAFIGFLVALLATALAMLQLERRRRVAVIWPAFLLLFAIVAVALHAPRQALLLGGSALLCAGFLTLAAEPGPRQALFWLVPAGLCGFLDGFVLPSMLAPLRLAERIEAPMALAYDLGSLLVGAALMALFAGAFALGRKRALVPSPAAFNDIAAACLGGLGAFWFLSRLHS